MAKIYVLVEIENERQQAPPSFWTVAVKSSLKDGWWGAPHTFRTADVTDLVETLDQYRWLRERLA
jgi:hypothetical protein